MSVVLDLLIPTNKPLTKNNRSVGKYEGIYQSLPPLFRV